MSEDPSPMPLDPLEAFEQVVRGHPGFRLREGQHRMARLVAATFADVTLGKVEPDEPVERAIAVIEAGTGVGKSLAYAAPAIATALARKTRVLISTATVALQEQLVNKDLPLLAQALDPLLAEPLRFALAKGRARYVCKFKLARLAEPSLDDEMADLLEEAESEESDAGNALRTDQDERRRLYQRLTQELADGQWDGDRDTLATPPDPLDWIPIAAEASTCTNRHCPVFSSCSYFERRKALVGAQVIVANHDLLLSSLDARLLPEPDQCLLVLDEAHHLPAVALDQFAARMSLTRLGWIDRLANRARKVGLTLQVSDAATLPERGAQLRQAIDEVARLVLQVYEAEWQRGLPPPQAPGSRGYTAPWRVRVPRGQLPEAFHAPLQAALLAAEGFIDTVGAIARVLRAELRDKPDEARRLAALYAQVGQLTPRLEGAHATLAWLLRAGEDAERDAASPVVAKWFTRNDNGGWVHLTAHASPVLPGPALRERLWSQARGAVLTSATLNAQSGFDFFLAESGLDADDAVTTLRVDSPFDYAAQGRLSTGTTRADPRQPQDYAREVTALLRHDLQAVRRGALVLFTSREQMRIAVEALTPAERDWVLVQNEWPRARLLQRHREAVAAGQRSVIFGMQSFGEGLDLPGAECEHLFITKLPFAPPDDPVGEARAEWLRARGRDPFNELVVPATAMRLAQWMGRAIRTEVDEAQVVCYDRRLSATAYGRRILAALPPFARQERNN